jgi:Leucine-rich repeat (LRR) protein
MSGNAKFRWFFLAPPSVNIVDVKAIWNWADKHNISKHDIPREKDALLNLKRLSFINLEYIGEKRFTSLPKEVGNLKKLTFLQLGDIVNAEMVLNCLTELPIEICELPELAYLHLQLNDLCELPAWIGNLTKLKELKLGGNFLTSLPKEIGKLEKLEVLTIWQNDLEEIPKEISFLKNLRGLDLSSNKLTKLPNEITNLTELKIFLYDDEKVQLSEEQKKWVTTLKNNGCEL